jgi:hypothetical protein
MKMKLNLLAMAGALAAAVTPAQGNGLREPTLAEKMARSELVVIGTVNRTSGRPGLGSDGMATLTVLTTLKGEASEVIIVSTSSTVAELDPRCCEVGATYLMFLRAGSGGRYQSVSGGYGIVRVGGRTDQIQMFEGQQR